MAVRVPRVLALQVKEAAEISGTDVSTYIRNTLFAAQAITTAAAAEIRKEAAAGERRLVDRDLQRLRAQLAEAFDEVATSRVTALGLERDLNLLPLRLLILTIRVLRGGQRERQEFNEIWAHLDPSDQTRLLPAIVMAMTEYLRAARDAEGPVGRDSARPRLFADAGWLIGLIEKALARDAPRDPTPATEGLAAVSDASKHGMRGEEAGNGSSLEVCALTQVLLGKSTSVPRSPQETRHVEPDPNDLGQVALSEEPGALEVLLTQRVRQEAAYPVYTSPTMLGGSPAITLAELLSRIPTGAGATCPVELRDADTEGGRVHAAMEALPPPQAWAQELGIQTNDGWALIPSEAWADMWS
jgi:hypothetical protein